MEAGVAGVGLWVAFALTLMVYCYLGRDIPFFNAVYRIAAYAFVGVALGYGAVMAWHGVLLPRLMVPLTGGSVAHLVPLVLCLLLLSRVKRSWSGLGNLTIAFLFGVGAALAVGGALIGTLIPQTRAAFVSLNPEHYRELATMEGALPTSYALDAFLLALGTISTLLYFYFTRGQERHPVARGAVHLAAGFGKVFLMFTFGALFATAAISRISLLVDRFRFLVETVMQYLPTL
jgi:hypothetical protein